MNKVLQLALLLFFLLCLGTQAYAHDQFDNQFFSKEDGWDKGSPKTVTINNSSNETQNMEDCAVPMDEGSVAPTKPKRKKNPIRKPKPVKLKEPDPNAPVPPGESLAKVITEETRLNPLYEPKKPMVRKVYDPRNRLPDKYFINKPPTKENSHIPKTVFQKDFSSLLFTAIEKQDIGAISALLERGADINAKTADTGFTPLMTAAWFNNEQVASYLIIKGANLNQQNGQGKTAMHLASEVGHYDIVSILIKSGAKWDIRDSEGRTAIDYAPQNIRQRLFINIAQTAKDKNAALLEMVCSGSAAAVKYLLDNGANIETKNKYGDTPLLIAVKHNNMETVNLLLSKGALLSVRNLQNEYPLLVAKKNQNQEMVNVIETVAIKQELDNGIVVEPRENIMAAPVAMVKTGTLGAIKPKPVVKNPAEELAMDTTPKQTMVEEDGTTVVENDQAIIEDKLPDLVAKPVSEPAQPLSAPKKTVQELKAAPAKKKPKSIIPEGLTN